MRKLTRYQREGLAFAATIIGTLALLAAAVTAGEHRRHNAICQVVYGGTDTDAKVPAEMNYSAGTWRLGGRIVGFSKSEDSTIYNLGECVR